MIDSIAANAIYDISKRLATILKSSDAFEISDDDFGIEQHLRETYSWARVLQFYGMSEARNTGECTIQLTIANKPRMFSVRSSGIESISEDDLILSGKSAVILGDPGSGKTTTIKRILIKLFTQVSEGVDGGADYPIFMSAKDLQGGGSVSDRLVEILGLKYTGRPKDGAYRMDDKERIRQRAIEQRSKKNIAAQSLSDLNVVLVFDGIDEVEVARRHSVFEELEFFRNAMQVGYVLATCRSGEFVYNLEGFTVSEIQPLTDGEIEDVIQAWSAAPDKFQDEIAKVHYKQVLNRPLFLTHLITLFDDSGRLPPQASDVYRLIINLLLERWDLSRRIDRSGYSSYASLPIDQKFDVLASIAFELLFSRDLKYFSDHQIEGAYARAAEGLGLPKGERREFIRDIQGHTGLITKTSFDEYGFSHFSLHEYLCANFLVRQPSVLPCVKNFVSYREVIAVTVSLSSAKEEFMLQLLASLYNSEQERMGISRALVGFLHRLKIENNSFKYDVKLGLSFLIIVHLLYRSHTEIGSILHGEAELQAFAGIEMLRAVDLGFRYFNAEYGESESEVRLFLSDRNDETLSGFPQELLLPSDFRNYFTPANPSAPTNP